VKRLALLIAARNAKPVVGRLLSSARRENSFDEILVYDDASSDGTMEEARLHGATVIRGEMQIGPSAARNCLAQQSTCGWVHFHDAADELASGFTDRARRWMAEVDCDAVLFATEDRDVFTGTRLSGCGWDEEILRADPVRFHIEHSVMLCGIYRRRAFLASGGFDEDQAVRCDEHQAMHLRLALNGLRFRADPHVGVIIYRRENSMSASDATAAARARIEVLNRVALATGDRYQDAIGLLAWQLAGVCASSNDWAAVERCLSMAARVGYVDPYHEHWLVRVVARFDAATAVRLREVVIRLLGPSRRARPPMPIQPVEGHVR